MENEKIAQLLFKLQMDDLKDADMLADYARKIMDYGDSPLSQAMVNRAKARLAQTAECQKTIDTVMQRIKDEKAAAGQMYEGGGMYAEMLNSYIEEWTEKIHHKLEAM